MGALVLVSIGYEAAQGTATPAMTTARRAIAVARRVAQLCGIGEAQNHEGGRNEPGPWKIQARPGEASEIATQKHRVYAFGIWPIGMTLAAREISRDGPLDFVGFRLVWWSGSARHVLDTADRSNGRLPAGSTSAEVTGWVPFEASAYGVEVIGARDGATGWRERWLHGSRD